MMSEATPTGPGERVLWSGTPEPLRFSLRKSFPGALIGIPFFAFSLFWISMASRAPGGAASPFPFPFWLFGIPFVLVGLGMVLSPVWHYARALRTSYVLTNRRAIVDYPGPFGRRISVPLTQIPFIETRGSFGNYGHVLFQEAVVSSYNRGGLAQRDGFVAVADPAQPEQLLRAAVERASGPGLQKSNS
jgi:hypothetical protein